MSTDDPRIAFFDHHAAAWDTYGPPLAETLVRLDELAPLLGLQPGWDVLEVGCGTGQVTPWLVERVCPGRVTSADFAPAMVTRARARGAAAAVHCVDVCDSDVGDALYDLVWCMHVVPHLRDHAAALRNLSRALKPGGTLLVLHLDSWQNINAYHDQVGGAVSGDHLPDPDGWRALLPAVGLQLDAMTERDNVFLLRAHRVAGA